MDNFNDDSTVFFISKTFQDTNIESITPQTHSLAPLNIVMVQKVNTP